MQKIDKIKLGKLVQKYAKSNPLRAALIQFVCSGTAEFNYFVTLTYRTDVKCRYEVEKHCRYFMQRYNKAFGYDKFWKRVKYNKAAQAQMVTFVEGGTLTKRFHCHFMLYKPESMSLVKFAWKTRRCWQYATNGAGGLLVEDYRRITDFVGLNDYLSKEIYSTNLNALCLGATHVY